MGTPLPTQIQEMMNDVGNLVWLKSQDEELDRLNAGQEKVNLMYSLFDGIRLQDSSQSVEAENTERLESLVTAFQILFLNRARPEDREQIIQESTSFADLASQGLGQNRFYGRADLFLRKLELLSLRSMIEKYPIEVRSPLWSRQINELEGCLLRAQQSWLSHRYDG
jgi:hypothetical protein